MTNLEKEMKQVMIVCANVLDIGSTRLSCPVLIIEYLVFYAADLVLQYHEKDTNENEDTIVIN